ncbi:Lys63-specific deubiquitinase [Aureococcus anophagefferens]|nr:Lys63-specific deubiquitinase [Aureococcus anophagefferens]
MVSRERTVTLHVYDFVATGSRTSAALSWLQLGLHHSGVEINGSEYSFNDGGVFKAPPQACSRGAAPQCVLVESLHLGAHVGSVNDFNGVLNDLRRAFPPGSYALTSRNCNHFSDAFVRALGLGGIPARVNRAASYGRWLGLGAKRPRPASSSVLVRGGAGPEYADALAALECAWWLARVLVHRALGTALLFAIVVLHLVSHYRVLLVRSYVLIWWRLECDADDLELDCTWTQTLETAMRRSRRFWRAGHYYSALRSLERVYESVRSTWRRCPTRRLDCTLTNVRLRHPKNAGETEATRRAGHAATAKVGLLTVLNRHFESEDAADGDAAYIRKNQESFAEAMHREQHECEEHVRHQAEKFEEATQKPWLYIALQVELRALAHVVIYNLQRQYTNVNRILEVIWEDWEEWVDDLTGGRYDVWERNKHDAEQLESARGRVGRKMKRIQKMLLRGGKGRDLIPSISILNEEIICERKRAQFLWLNQIVFRTLLNSSFDNVTNLISGVTDSIDALTHALTHPFHRRDGSARSKKGAAVAGLAMDPAYLAVHGALNGVKEVSQGITDGGKAIANGFMSGNIISAGGAGPTTTSSRSSTPYSPAWPSRRSPSSTARSGA